MLEFEIYI